jgi:adenylyltransferase/sulfurtransferase
MNKARSAAILLQNFNPQVIIKTYENHFSNNNAIEIAKEYDILLDCTDNPATRYLINDVCVLLGKPLVSGSAVQWEGQLTVYVMDSIKRDDYNKLPCYRCLFPIPSPSSSVCNCADAGVFGPVPGVIGTLQCNEAVKLVLGLKEKLLSKRMLMYDALDMSFKIFKLRNYKEDCVVCGKDPKITLDNLKDYDYENFVNPKSCRVPLRLEIPSSQCLNWKEFVNLYEKEKEETLILDVRPEDQFNLVNLSNKFEVKNFPLKDIQVNFEKYKKEIKLDEIKNKKIFVICKRGNASTHATKLLIEKGYFNIFNINDGLDGYRKNIDQNFPNY